jgi:SAM-dependent methyltransferase
VTVFPQAPPITNRDSSGPPELPADPLTPRPAEGGYPDSGVAPLSLAVARCCLCGDVPAEPVAVTEDFDYRTSRDSFLVLRCTRCRSLYVNPAPSEDELQRIYPAGYWAEPGARRSKGLSGKLERGREAHRLAEWCRNLDADARILDVGCGAGRRLRLLRHLNNARWRLEGVESSETAVQIARQAGLTVHPGSLEHLDLDRGRYDLVLLIGTVEHAGDPIATLSSVRSLLRPTGRAVIVAQNLASPSFVLFGGRHWGAYDFPRQRRLFTVEGLRRLAGSAGLEVASLSTLSSAATWLRSMHRLLQDWGAPAWLRNRFGESSWLAAAAFAVVETLDRLRGGGNLVVAILRRPEGDR